MADTLFKQIESLVGSPTVRQEECRVHLTEGVHTDLSLSFAWLLHCMHDERAFVGSPAVRQEGC